MLLLPEPMLTFNDILRTSRPLFWLNTSVLWVLALLALGQRPSWTDVLMIVYFTLPFNLWLHGINDVYDYEADRLNERKGGDEGALLPPSAHPAILRAALWSNTPFVLFAAWQGNPRSTLLLGIFIFLGWAYSAPPIRGKSRPVLDGLINVAYCLPFVIALVWHDAGLGIWQRSLPAFIAFSAWSIGSHAFTSIQDIDADRAAGVSTIAAWLGEEKTALFALVWYLVAASAGSAYGWWWGGILIAYVLYVLYFLENPTRERANALYRWFIVTNSAFGFAVTVVLAVNSPSNTLWAALALTCLVAAVILALANSDYPEHGTGASSTKRQQKSAS